MPTSLRHLDHNQEISPSSAFGLVIEVSEDVEISVFSAAEAVERPILASLVTRSPADRDGNTVGREMLSIRTGGGRSAAAPTPGPAGNGTTADAGTDETTIDNAAGQHDDDHTPVGLADIQRSDG
ncbi:MULTISPECIES: hypothetical protein [unclassified Frankia]|uniref:hypothetical protein n=1 Tax=unclassified Frankia TaxID=2632575 RepID=UPI002AD27814|nr:MULTISPECIES: hypothetical protein [unclassified Frankia]